MGYKPLEIDGKMWRWNTASKEFVAEERGGRKTKLKPYTIYKLVHWVLWRQEKKLK